MTITDQQHNNIYVCVFKEWKNTKGAEADGQRNKEGEHNRHFQSGALQSIL